MTTEAASAKRQLMPLAWRRAQAVDGSDAHARVSGSLHFMREKVKGSGMPSTNKRETQTETRDFQLS